jgi:hypothetical protein
VFPLAEWRVKLGVLFASIVAMFAVCAWQLYVFVTRDYLGPVEDEWGMPHDGAPISGRDLLAIIATFVVGVAIVNHFGKGRPYSGRPPWRDDLMKEPSDAPAQGTGCA